MKRRHFQVPVSNGAVGGCAGWLVSALSSVLVERELFSTRGCHLPTVVHDLPRRRACHQSRVLVFSQLAQGLCEHLLSRGRRYGNGA